MLTLLVAGALANRPLRGGAAWTRLQYVLGFRKLGCRVYFVEQIDPATCVDDAGRPIEFERSLNLSYFTRIAREFGLDGTAALVCANGERTAGMSWPDLLEVAAAAHLLVNIGGHLTLDAVMRRIRRKAFVDQDPGFTQFWHLAGRLGRHLEAHDVHFTVGENIGRPGCEIPTGGIRWYPARQPVVLEHWPVSGPAPPDRFTTVGTWRGPYGPVQVGDRTLGLKVHEFRKFLELPRRAPGHFEVALAIDPADGKDLDALHHHGWRVVDPTRVAGDPAGFRRYVQGSGAEFSVAQGVYVDAGSGWFSDRTARYLASGKPALVQDTGFSRNYPVGDGLVSFRTLDQAVAGAGRILADYERHARAARALAEAYFDSDTVLAQLLERAGLAS